LDGGFTNPATGAPLPLDSPNRTHIAIAAAFPSRFLLTIYVENCGGSTLENVVVYDTIKNTITYTDYNPSKGEVSIDPPGEQFQKEKLTWIVGTIESGDTEYLEVYLETLPNPSGKYEPTSGDEGDWQDIEINEGANVTASSAQGLLKAMTEDITLQIVDDGIEDNGIGLIQSPVLPYYTPWAKDELP